MTQSSKPDLIHGPIAQTLRAMTVPMILGMVMLMTFGLVDTFFVSLLGTDQLAAISFTFPVTFTLISLNIGLGIGTSATIARFLGAGKSHLAKEYGTGALMLSFLLVGVLAVIGFFTIEPIFRLIGATETEMPYIRDYMQVWYLAGALLAMPMVGNSVLRASGDTKTPSIIMAFGGLINAVLDPLLIFGWGPFPALGIQGAAIATLIAWAVGCTYIIYLLAIKRGLILPRLLTLAELRMTSKDILKIGLPAAGANMLTPLATGVLTAIIAGYGSEAVAAWGVGGRLESIACIVVLALSMSLPPFISQNYGAGRLDRVKDGYLMCLRFVMLWQIGIFLLMWFASPLIAMAFAEEQKVAELIRLFLMVVPLGYGLQGVIILTNSSFNAMHKPMSALLLSILRLFVFLVPISYLGSQLYDLPGMFWAGVLANLLTACLAFMWFRRLLREEAAVQMAEGVSG
ncbi:MATE family efflux transporter [Aliiglaciecola sp. CAU 1673]|uniref:MATE family efflux transporter n=1 Tax=Aliiglaciecola sp. CAU 1673 TaxID=3032595 RepID=UPI0023DC92F6|nr:MATE family efflux transporter [Aliiglaciecola sp. CAU 1673]MDF2179324.1 MATE family efflux transporter [Aliiglaciecola sp. CAU 1673]